MSHHQIRLFCHGITFAALQYIKNNLRQQKLHLKRYGCERYKDGLNDQNPDFYANLMILPSSNSPSGSENYSKCGYCLEANYDSKYNARNGKSIIRILIGIRNDEIKGVVNPEVIYKFMNVFQNCETVAKSRISVNPDHWIAWVEIHTIDLSNIGLSSPNDAEKEGQNYFYNSICNLEDWKNLMSII